MFRSRLPLKDELWFKLASGEVKTLLLFRKETVQFSPDNTGTAFVFWH